MRTDKLTYNETNGQHIFVTFYCKHGEKKIGPRPVQSVLLLFEGRN
jgi:hypothetical protein